MNNFYGILKIIQISDIEIDYYDKCKFRYYITCEDCDIKLKIKCNEKFIETLYSKLEVDKYIFVYGNIGFSYGQLYIFPKEIMPLELVL